MLLLALNKHILVQLNNKPRPKIPDNPLPGHPSPKHDRHKRQQRLNLLIIPQTAPNIRLRQIHTNKKRRRIKPHRKTKIINIRR